MDAISLPSRQSIITLQGITVDNWTQITRLVVNKDQLELVAPNLNSLCEHQFYTPRSIVRAIVADATPVGYIRLQLEGHMAGEDRHEHGQVHKTNPLAHLLTFMIDQACQGLGFGTKAMKLLQREMVQREEPLGIKVLTKSFVNVHPDDSPEHFFTGLGFNQRGGPLAEQEMIWIPAR
ncbi:hypothetical protein EDD11_006001 [Mortierella claussenii]|nr:hypothetical protein EDD11_006001 [Mortierella claussenii]